MSFKSLKFATKKFSTSSSASQIEKGVWHDFSSRPKSLGIKNTELKTQLLSGVDPKKGPVTLKSSRSKKQYRVPQGLDEVFPLAYNILQKNAASVYAGDNNGSSSTKDTLKNSDKMTQIEAEKYNPEVLYKSQFSNPEKLDLDVPVYQYYYKTKHYDGYNKMLLMQRIEQLHVLPDAIPTIDPQIEFNVKFVSESGVNRWIEPGEILSTRATARPPVFETVYLDLNNELSPEQQYSIVIVDLDVPDVEYNSYQINLNYGVCNLSLQSNRNVLEYDVLSQHEFAEYVPSLPEKNTPLHRVVALLLKQKKHLDNVNVQREGLDLAEFLAKNELEPVGVNVWRNGWDLGVEGVRNLYGVEKGRVFHRVRR